MSELIFSNLLNLVSAADSQALPAQFCQILELIFGGQLFGSTLGIWPEFGLVAEGALFVASVALGTYVMHMILSAKK